jgi:hypothetical protein
MGANKHRIRADTGDQRSTGVRDDVLGKKKHWRIKTRDVTADEIDSAWGGSRKGTARETDAIVGVITQFPGL